MSKKIKPEDLQKSVMDILQEYKDVSVEVMDNAVKNVSKEAVDELHNANPTGSGKYGSWKDYNKGWASKVEKKGPTKITSIVHNKTHYRLTHLLEKGHALRGGGKTKAFPHIAPVDEKCAEMLEEEIKKGIEHIK